jgi:hypothetical protein
MAKKIMFVGYMAFLLIFFVSGRANAGYEITPEARLAFNNVANGTPPFPVYQVADGAIRVDGLASVEEWSEIIPRIYMNGDWMWNPNYANGTYLWKDSRDFMAVMRMVHDNLNLYVSIVFFDDVHVIGTPSFNVPEAWIQNDCAEFSFIPVLGTTGVNVMPPIMASQITRIIRRFISAPGLIGTRDGVKYPINENGTGGPWAAAEPEGSHNLGGVQVAAAPVPARSQYLPILHDCRGSWMMEIKIPFWGLFNTDQVPAAGFTGNRFKFNLTMFDDDTVVKSPSLLTTAHLFRNTAWWDLRPQPLNKTTAGFFTDSSFAAYFAYAPVFELAGPMYGDPVTRIEPDMDNLYTGNYQEYEDFWFRFTVGLEQAGLSALPGGNNLNISPNPVRSSAQINFALPAASPARLQVFDLGGRMVRDLGLKGYAAGINRIVWDGRDSRGAEAVSGTYIIRLNAGQQIFNRPVTIVK